MPTKLEKKKKEKQIHSVPASLPKLQGSVAKRLKLMLAGTIQGVGFRPFVYRLANDLNLKGYVQNTGSGVVIEVEGAESLLEKFHARLLEEKPARAFIQRMELAWLRPRLFSNFAIVESAQSDLEKSAWVPSDIATCSDCLEELFDDTNRRYGYPFINCTQCGPRLSILEKLPYDRLHTTMKTFLLCSLCQKEYNSPEDRRFHAEPNACPQCGPQCQFLDAEGNALAQERSALRRAIEELKRGKIVAIKGLGGFHLMTLATRSNCVERLRNRKVRQEKPFALMAPNFDWITHFCTVSKLERQLLLAPEAPIVLLRRKASVDPVIPDISANVAPGNPYLGWMMPYTPLHHIVMRAVGVPLVATSANVSEEPIVFQNEEALKRLHGIADFFLTHDRPIERPLEDSIVRECLGRPLVLRRARGYASLPIDLTADISPALAVGAHQKNTVAVSSGKSVFLSPHIGDLETALAIQTFEKTIADLQEIYPSANRKGACDLHPEYYSSRYLMNHRDRYLLRVQHHHAHILSAMADNELQSSVLGVAWDGTGFGTDGTIWGGEFLSVDKNGFQRFAHLKTFALPGSGAAIKSPRQVAVGLLYGLYNGGVFLMSKWQERLRFSTSEWRVLERVLSKEFQAPITSSMGRLFDGVSALLGLAQENSFEAEAAMKLEFAAQNAKGKQVVYPFALNHNATTQAWELDWRPMLEKLLEDLEAGKKVEWIASTFHNTLIETLVAVCKKQEEKRIVLSGGCFQNKILLESAVTRLKEEGFVPFWHQRVPPNDGGIALGQMLALAQEEESLRSNVGVN